MTKRLPQIKPKEILKVLDKFGFINRRQTGSHVILKHSETKRMVAVPVHNKDLKMGLLLAILKQANISKKELIDAL